AVACSLVPGSFDDRSRSATLGCVAASNSSSGSEPLGNTASLLKTLQCIVSEPRYLPEQPTSSPASTTYLCFLPSSLLRLSSTATLPSCRLFTAGEFLQAVARS